MPGSLLSRVRRSDSARSDRSDASAKSCDSWKSSGKKVSFNRAVRVKKFPRRTDALHDDTDDVDEKRFWFRVYKNNNNSSSNDGSLRRRKLLGEADPSSPERDEFGNMVIRPLDPIAEIPPHRHRASPGMRLTADVGVGTSGDTLHSSQQFETPTVRRNHVKKLVNRFNEEAVLKFGEEEPPPSPTFRYIHNGSPPEPPVDYVEESKQRRNPLVNGVKVIFGGMSNLKSKKSETKLSSVWRKNQANLKKTLFGGEARKSNIYDSGPPYKTSIVLADEYARARNNNNIYKSLSDEKGLSLLQENGVLVQSKVWDSGDQLVSDVSRYETTVDKNDLGGQTYRTLQEGNRVWKHETRTIYEEEPPSPVLSEQRRAKSHGDLRSDGTLTGGRHLSGKVFSIDDLSRERRGVTRDRATQCNRSRERGPTSTLQSSHRVIRPSLDGLVSAYSDVPSLKVNGTTTKHQPPSEAIYSQVDKNKKLLDKKSASTLSLSSRPPAKVKSSQKSFGFRLKKAFGATLPDQRDKGNTYVPAKDEDGNWYDVDSDVAAAAERSKGHHDISEVRVELEEERNGDDERSEKGRATPGSVVREVDHRKREICYENTAVRGKTDAKVEAGGLWYRGAEEDYRKEMAQSDVSFPSGNHVGSSVTLGRPPLARQSSLDKPKAYTLDRRHTRSKSPTNANGSAVKILVNGQEVEDLDALTSRQARKKYSDHTGRGGLAAAYKARQKAALKRSNSVSGSRHSVSGLGLSSGASSSAASSDGENSRRRRTLVMYIPGVSHGDHRSDSDDKRSGISRTQSLHAISKPSKYQKHGRKGAQHHRYVGKNASDASTVASEEADTLGPLRSDPLLKGKGSVKKSELRRRHSMPKDTKFGWFKWKIKSKNRDST